MANKTTRSLTLPKDSKLTSDHFVIGPKGEVAIKDAQIQGLLKSELKRVKADPNVAAVTVTVGVDF